MVDFSHEYSKMPQGWKLSRLLQVFTVKRDELSHEFEQYDTEIKGGGNYKLPQGRLIVLLLETEEEGQLWTTVRRCTPSKYYWYRGLMGFMLPMRLTPTPQKKLTQPEFIGAVGEI